LTTSTVHWQNHLNGRIRVSRLKLNSYRPGQSNPDIGQFQTRYLM
jgi:hypothetical protein